jgi:phage terminase large subunit
MWMQELVYDKGLNEKQLAYRLKPYNNIKKYIDSANPLYIQNLEDCGLQLVYPVVKYANSIIDGINKVQGYKLHVIKGSVNLIKELNNYCWMKDRHEAFTNSPIDKFNHGKDAMRYSTMSDRSGRATRKIYNKDELNFNF